MKINNVAYRFFHAAEEYPENIALEVGDKQYNHSELRRISFKIADILVNSSSQKFVGILSFRSLATYAGILGSYISGKCYVPFNPKFPVDRIVKILELTGCDILIADSRFKDAIEPIINALGEKITIISIEGDDVEIPESASSIKIKTNEELDVPFKFEKEIDATVDGYLFFTSGSTGEPKGIPVNHSNLNAYLNNALPKYKLTPADRVSQSFDTTFDPSFHDMFMAWANAATLVVVPEEQLISPHKFIADKKLTVWASVPSIGRFMARMRTLKPGSFPLLKYTLFTGEALTFEVYEQWKLAAPNSEIINGYGPTELTMNIADFWIPESLQLEDCYNGIVPIGIVFPDHDYMLLNNDVPSEIKGEMLISGPQKVVGYFKDSTKTAHAFLIINGKEYYKTGDMVENSSFGLKYKGRVDNQLQVRGFRVELNEIEFVIKKYGIVDVVALGHPEKNGVADGIIVFIGGEKKDEALIMAHCKKYLPDYMVPSKLIFLENLPLNVNGKFDKQKLKEILNNNGK